MDKYDNLQQLQKLKDEGSLSETEFEVEKEKLLSSNANSHPQSQSNTKLAFIIAGILFLVFVIAGFVTTISLNNDDLFTKASKAANSFNNARQ